MIVGDFLECSVLHIQDFTTQREDAVFVSSYNAEPRDSHSFRRIALSKYYGAQSTILSTRKVCVIQLRHDDTRYLLAVRFHQLLFIVKLGDTECLINNTDLE